MNAGLTMMSDDDLTRLRDRITELARAAPPAQRAAASQQLEVIDIERERRLSAPVG